MSDFELPVEKLKSKASNFSSFTISSSGTIQNQVSSLNTIPSGTLPIISTIINRLNSLSKGLSSASSWENDYASELESVENNLMETPDSTVFVGSFENMFAKATVPTLKSSCDPKDRKIETHKIAVKPLTGKQNEADIYEYFASLGFNTAAICGILANIERESSYRTGAIGDGGLSYGICQWYDSRCTDLKNFCNSNRLDWKSLHGQLEFLTYELENKYTSVYNALKNVPNNAQGAYDAASIWTYKFENPAHADREASYRGNNAKNNYWNHYSNQNFVPTTTNKTTSNTAKRVKTSSSGRPAKDELDLRFNSLNKQNYNDDCPRVVTDSLISAGVISDANNLYPPGKELASAIYNRYSGNPNYQVSHYTIQNHSNAAGEFDNFVNQNGNENIVLSFSRGWGSNGATMGHTMLITRIENGKVYFIDNADFRNQIRSNGYGVHEYIVNYNDFLNMQYFGGGQPVLSDMTIINKK